MGLELHYLRKVCNGATELFELVTPNNARVVRVWPLMSVIFIP